MNLELAAEWGSRHLDRLSGGRDLEQEVPQRRQFSGPKPSA